MSEENSILDINRKGRLSADITYLMLKGAGYAMILLLAVWFTVAVIAFIGGLLPEESQQADDPSPWSSLEVPAARPALA